MNRSAGPESFDTRKITRAAVAIKPGLAERAELGDLSAVRDWSFAGDVMTGGLPSASLPPRVRRSTGGGCH